MVDRSTCPDSGERPASDLAEAAPEGFTAAMRELAGAIGELATAIRQSAAFADAEFELVPCERTQGATDEASFADVEPEGDPCGCAGATAEDPAFADAGDQGPCSRDGRTSLSLVPQPRGAQDEQTPCRPGVCGCRHDDGLGRHARREGEASDVVEPAGLR